MDTLSPKTGTTHQRRPHHSMNLEPRVLPQHQHHLSRGSSGLASMSFCSPVLDIAWDWGTFGGSLTFVIAMEEVSGLQAEPHML